MSRDLYRVLEAAQRLAERSDGAFDVTIGPVTHLWRQGDLRIAKRWRGADGEIWCCGHGTAQLKLAGMQLDLGAIAKGFAADEALAVLRAHGVRRALVAVSGDIAAGDPPPGKKDWTIRVEPGGREVLLNNAADLDFRRRRTIHQRRRRSLFAHHRSENGLGLTNHIAVTVIARRGLDADPLATTLSILGEQRGRAMLQRYYPRATAFFTTSHANERGSINSK